MSDTSEWSNILQVIVALVLMIGLPFLQDMFPILKYIHYLLPVLFVILALVLMLSLIQLGGSS